MEKYKVLIDSVIVEGVAYPKDSIIELDSNDSKTIELLTSGTIGLVATEEILNENPELRDVGVQVGTVGVATDVKMIQYVVVKGPVSNEKAEVFQTDNVIEFPENDTMAAGMVEAGLIVLKSERDEFDRKAKAMDQDPTMREALDKTVGMATLPVKYGTAADTEPRNRYRGKVIIDEYERTVENQTFRHIRLENGDELDLTEKEYAGEVHVSYPPQDA